MIEQSIHVRLRLNYSHSTERHLLESDLYTNCEQSMFDVVLASAPATSFAPRVASALRDARMRVISCEVGPHQPLPTALRVDAAVACGPSGPAMLDVARSLRGALDGPPPVIGVSGGTPPAPTSELAQSLPEAVAAPVLVASVQRAAARAERRRSRVVLSGVLDDVGFASLLASLASRGRSCFVRVLAGSRRAEVTLDGGRPTHVRADGSDGARDKAALIAMIGGWAGATFEVVVIDEAAPQARPRESERAPASAASPGAADVALAAAVINACAAYARAFSGGEQATAMLTTSWARTRVVWPALEAFAISREGMVSVSQVARAKAAVPQALAEWIVAFFDDAGHSDPVRFRRVRLREVLGGLTRLVEQVGWASALLEDPARRAEARAHG